MKQQEERVYGEYQILLLWEEGKLKTESAFRSYFSCYFAEEFQCSFFCPTIPHKGVLIRLFSAAVFNDFSSNLLEKTTSQSVLHSFFPHFILLEGSLDLPISLTD